MDRKKVFTRLFFILCGLQFAVCLIQAQTPSKSLAEQNVEIDAYVGNKMKELRCQGKRIDADTKDTLEGAA